MTNNLAVIIPFPKRFDIQHSSTPIFCPFQTHAERQAVMLQRLLIMLSGLGGSSVAPVHLDELCQHARELLNDIVLCYRGALALAEGGASHE